MDQTTTGTMYGLRNKKTKKLISYTTSSNSDASFCVDTTFFLKEYGDDVWLVETALHAEYVRNFSTPYYNAAYETPNHDLNPENIEVVKVITKRTISPMFIKIPSYSEFLRLKYEEKNPEYYQHLISEINLETGRYSLYDLERLLEQQER